MKKSHRDRLLRLAKALERFAASIRRYCKETTPKRGPRRTA
jgi:hypothetical protein